MSAPKPAPAYRTLPYPYAQRQAVDWSELMSRQHTIHGLVEVDVTETRRAIHRWRRSTGQPLSFTALVVASFAAAVGAEPSVQAVRKGRGRVVVFEDVDVAVLVEHVLAGSRVPIPHVVRRANRKTPARIDREIAAARAEATPYSGALRLAPLWLLLPGFARRFVLSRVLASPFRRKRITGTAAVTAVGMFGTGTGWGIPLIGHSICLTIGGIGRRPGLTAEGAIEPREFVSLTVSVDHDVVNGAPLARFIGRLRDSIETGSLLLGSGPRPS
jgi:pyruvate/2-oxoglutarate dehydrogenase complex dihydrolipoamide acyltransferase (E2) component